MDKSRLSINILMIVGFLVIVIFAVSVFSIQQKNNQPDYPKISAKSPSRGPVGAPVKIIEFGDFQCPYCKELARLFKTLENDYKDKIRFVWKDFPLIDIHEKALTAAEVARCAQEQNKFWEMHDKIFENQLSLNDQIYISLAEQIDLDQQKFIDCVSQNKKLDLVQKDVEEGLRLGVAGTPHFYINKYEITELITIEQMKMLVESELYK